MRSVAGFKTVAGAGCVMAFMLICGCSPPRGVYHTVQRGQTLYRIGHTYGLDAAYLARVNGIRDPSQLRVGTRLFIPGARSRRYVSPTVPSAVSSKTATNHQRRSKAASSSAGTARKSNRVKTGASAVDAGAARVNRNSSQSTKKSSSKSTKVKFIWPVHGKLVKSFGQQGYGGKKGIEIAVHAGDQVVAAAAGRVTYSGNGIKGYGNLIILKHADDLFSVYGFNRKNLVSVGGYVSKGERIALAGSPPGTEDARLHFEIRHGKDALNPVSYLP